MSAERRIDIAGARTDIPARSPWTRWAPAAWRPYLRLARLDRPIGTWLLLWPCWWALALAAPAWPDPLYLLLFAIGALVMRGAGCAWNDIADRDVDGRVERTATRPIPAGEVSVLQAGLFMAALCLIGAAILVSFNHFAILVGLAAAAPVVVYPFMKRITWWPQLFLGFAFNWGALLGWAAVRGSLDAPALWLYVGGIFWTLGYDTIYAHQDKEDDATVGIKSSALRLGRRTRPALWLFYGAAVVLFAFAGLTAGLVPAFLVGLAIAAALLVWQVLAVNLDDPLDCLTKFRANTWFGWLLFAAIIAGNALQT